LIRRALIDKLLKLETKREKCMTLKRIDSDVKRLVENKADKMKNKFSSLLKRSAKKEIYRAAVPNIDIDVIDALRKHHVTESKEDNKPSKDLNSDKSPERTI
jgi:hypothetical protein